MKRFIVIALALVLFCGCFAGCQKKSETTETARLMYNYDMTQYVTLDSYKVDIDRTSAEYREYLNAKLRLMMTVEKKEGTVAMGDTVNIDYTGKKDGVAFEGGSATGHDLTIGSGQFIPGFEEGLVGKQIGSTVELNLKFPDDYKASPELAGQAVVFTVKINLTKKTYDHVNNETAKLCGYKDFYEVRDLAREYADENYAWDVVYKRAKFEELPERENRILYNTEMNYYEAMAEKSNMTVESLLQYYGYTSQELENELNNETVPYKATTYALSYYILDKEDVKVTAEDIRAVREEIEEELGMSVKDAGVSDSYIEAEAARKLAIGIVADNVKITKNDEIM